MKFYMLKNLLSIFALTLAIPLLQAQFDDVYYDPDAFDPTIDYNYHETTSSYAYEDDVTYYDNEEYAYYDDYDYYYTSRLRRFHSSYSGFGFYDPIYTSFNYYDPFAYDAYYYPGSSIYISFGSHSYWDYYHWRKRNRWNRWNHHYGWNNWCVTPASYYYSYNSWCPPSYNYWGGYHGYYSYSNYYNNYYNYCPLPVTYYHGITGVTVNNVNSGGTRGSYYGPRISGNTGSSPRGPVQNPGLVQPVFKEKDTDVTQSNDRPSSLPESGKPGRVNPTDPAGITDHSPKPGSLPGQRTEPGDDVVRQIPVDRELTRDESTPTQKRPVFRPDAEKYRPYPSGEKSASNSDRPSTQKPAYRPYTPQERPDARPGSDSPDVPRDRDNYTPTRSDQKPSYTPPSRGTQDMPKYTPPTRSNDDRPTYQPPRSREQERPSYTPPPRNETQKSDDRPSYTPPPRNDSQRSNDRPSYSPPARSNDSGRSSGGGSNYSPTQSRSGSSGSSRSGGGGGSQQSPSPRGKG